MLWHTTRAERALWRFGVPAGTDDIGDARDFRDAGGIRAVVVMNGTVMHFVYDESTGCTWMNSLLRQRRGRVGMVSKWVFDNHPGT